MATGEPAFKGDTAISIISSIIKDTPPAIAEVNPRVPTDLTRIVKRALTKDPDRRYQSAKDLRNELELLQDDLKSR